MEDIVRKKRVSEVHVAFTHITGEFAPKIVINTFLNNKQTVAADMVALMR